MSGIDPGYQQLDINEQLAAGGLVPVASGQGHDAAISIHQKEAVPWAARLNPGERIEVPDAAYGHIFMAKGSNQLVANGRLNTGDAVRLTGTDELSLVADQEGAEVLI